MPFNLNFDWEPISLDIVISSLLTSKTASITAGFSLFKITSFYTFNPKAQSRALIMILFPAPVSPHKTLKPFLNSKKASSISIKFLIKSDFSILFSGCNGPM